MIIWKVTWFDGSQMHELEFTGFITELLNHPIYKVPPGASTGSLPSEYNIVSIVRVARPVVGATDYQGKP